MKWTITMMGISELHPSRRLCTSYRQYFWAFPFFLTAVLPRCGKPHTHLEQRLHACVDCGTEDAAGAVKAVRAPRGCRSCTLAPNDEAAQPANNATCITRIHGLGTPFDGLSVYSFFRSFRRSAAPFLTNSRQNSSQISGITTCLKYACSVCL